MSRVQGGAAAIVGLSLAFAMQSSVLAWVAAAWSERNSRTTWLRRRRLAWDVVNALESDEIEPRFHPMCRLSDGRCVGIEMNAQWHHPRRGAIATDEFRAALTSAGRLARFDELMWVYAAHERATLAVDSAALELFVAFAVMSDRLDKPGYTSELVDSLQAKGLSARGIVLRIPADYESSDLSTMATNIEGVRKLGVRVAIHDFGHGRANLAMLSKVTFDLMGFHPRLIELAATTPRGAAIAHVATRSAHLADTVAVAAGVRDDAWIPELRRLGFDVVHGSAVNDPLAPIRAVTTPVSSSPGVQLPPL
jgi:EAL domain-containing protein (putative c-di-GMP-specific phosphodiesterase class I)